MSIWEDPEPTFAEQQEQAAKSQSKMLMSNGLLQIEVPEGTPAGTPVVLKGWDFKKETRTLKNFAEEHRKALAEAKEEVLKRERHVRDLEEKLRGLEQESTQFLKDIPAQENLDAYSVAYLYWQKVHGSQDFDLAAAERELGELRGKAIHISERIKKTEGDFYDAYESWLLSRYAAGLYVVAFTEKDALDSGKAIYTPSILDVDGRVRTICPHCSREVSGYLGGTLMKNAGCDVVGTDCLQCSKMISFMIYGEAKRTVERTPRRSEPDPKLIQKGNELGAYPFMRGEWEPQPAQSLWEQGYNRVMATQREGGEAEK